MLARCLESVLPYSISRDQTEFIMNRHLLLEEIFLVYVSNHFIRCQKSIRLLGIRLPISNPKDVFMAWLYSSLYAYVLFIFILLANKPVLPTFTIAGCFYTVGESKYGHYLGWNWQKISLYADDLLLYISDPTEPIACVLDTHLWEISGYKLNLYKCIIFVS